MLNSKRKIIILVIFFIIFLVILFSIKKTFITSQSSSDDIAVSSVFIDELDINIFTDILSSYTTNYTINNVNRSNNVELATSKLDGVIILPR